MLTHRRILFSLRRVQRTATGGHLLHRERVHSLAIVSLTDNTWNLQSWPSNISFNISINFIIFKHGPSLKQKWWNCNCNTVLKNSIQIEGTIHNNITWLFEWFCNELRTQFEYIKTKTSFQNGFIQTGLTDKIRWTATWNAT